MNGSPGLRGASGWDEPAPDRLSGFARRCLLKHICDCHEAVALTLRGVASATRDVQRHAPVELHRIGDVLCAAEGLIEQAERLAAEQLD